MRSAISETNATSIAATLSARRRPSVAPSAAASITLAVVRGAERSDSIDSDGTASVSGSISLAITMPAGALITLAVMKCRATSMRAAGSSPPTITM